MKELLTFDDVLIQPRFSHVSSRKDIDLSGSAMNQNRTHTYFTWKLPVISANMDTVTGSEMANAMHQAGGLACLHRFWNINDNISTFEAAKETLVSIGLGELEFKRAQRLHWHGARGFIIDVAHGAQAEVANQYIRIKKEYPESFVIVGNFASGDSLIDFHDYMRSRRFYYIVDGVKVGVGPGSACTTRIKTGVGVPQLSAIMDIRAAYSGLVIGDGGCRSAGDVVKAIAAGADLVMLGGMLAGTDETPGVVEEYTGVGENVFDSYKFKIYRGSASKESYEAQGKTQSYVTPEGESFTVPYKGPVSAVLQDIEGGLRSAYSYVGASNTKEFRENATFVKITGNGVLENGAHGKKT